MIKGKMRMRDKRNDNDDYARRIAKSFTVISTTHSYIELHFYCQTSGNRKDPIELPITKPFYLLPNGSRECQQVKWMVATSEWIYYHTHDYQGYHQMAGTVPYHELGDSKKNGIKMYYCYYESKFKMVRLD
jgi:hypothetical protein